MPAFHWGVSTSAAQTEGAPLEDGRSPSIWDVFALKRRKIRDHSSPATGNGFYNRYRDDIALIRLLGIPNFRFSLSWSRILPNGFGSINQKGLDFYDRLTDRCLENNITPWITLYHWDLPQVLEDRGGWTNRDVLGWFESFATAATQRLGDRVKNWMVLNEPMAFTGAGYMLGVHAPGRRGRDPFVRAAHHAVLATARGASLVRDTVPDAYIGSTFSFSWIEPYRIRESDIKAAAAVDDLLNRFFLLPALGQGYPLQKLKFLDKIEKVIRPGDEQAMKADLDFVGVQCYTREVIRYNRTTPFIHASMVSPRKRDKQTTVMGWEIYPESIYKVLKSLQTIPGIPPLIVTENGSAFADERTADGSVIDPERQQYLENHISQVLRAKAEGVPVNGYFVWSLTDNFEWAEGYVPRFGLVHVDYANDMKRTVKASGKWYAKFLEGNR